jgi:hypothetical protein
MRRFQAKLNQLENTPISSPCVYPPSAPLSVGRGTGKCSCARCWPQANAYAIDPPARSRGWDQTRLGDHNFQATGSRNGGTLENAQATAAHESPRTTKLYDHTGDEITLDEIERILI